MGQYCPYCNQPVEKCICEEGVDKGEDNAPEPPRYDEPPPVQTWASLLASRITFRSSLAICFSTPQRPHVP
jgi:hypothetical protein